MTFLVGVLKSASSIKMRIAAVKQLSPEIRKKYPEITWRKIAGYRDILIHSYRRINVDEVWGVIKDNLPKLKQQI